MGGGARRGKRPVDSDGGDPQEEHIKVIGKTLSDAFMSKTEAISPALIEAMATRLANLEDFVSDEGGEVTSGSHSPMLEKGIGMGYVPAEHAAPGSALTIDVRGRPRKAEVVKGPIYKRED